MKKTVAFTPNFDNRLLFRTARDAREAEFDRLMIDISNHVGTREHLREVLNVLSSDLRGGVYPSAVKAFIKAAAYLEEFRDVLSELGPMPKVESA